MRASAESALAPLGLRPRHLVTLTLLRDHTEGTQQALSTRLQIDRTNLVGLLNDLESWGLIERRRSDADRRRVGAASRRVGAASRRVTAPGVPPRVSLRRRPRGPRMSVSPIPSPG